MNKKIIFLFLFLGGGSLSAYSQALSAFDKILVKYCVSRNAGECPNRATYVTATDECKCPDSKLYLDRECMEIKCEPGTYISIDNFTNDCSGGYGKYLYRL